MWVGKQLYLLLEALPPICMKYTARDEDRVANPVLYSDSYMIYIYCY